MKKIEDFNSLTEIELFFIKGGSVDETTDYIDTNVDNEELLSTVLKTMKEMESSIIRNIN